MTPQSLPQPERSERWLADEIAVAADIWQRQVTDLHGDNEPPRGLKERVIWNIAIKLNRKFFSVEARLRLQGASFGSAQVMTRYISLSRVPAKVLLDREARAEARLHQSETGRTFGDPPPGFSALDRRLPR